MKWVKSNSQIRYNSHTGIFIWFLTCSKDQSWSWVSLQVSSLEQKQGSWVSPWWSSDGPAINQYYSPKNRLLYDQTTALSLLRMSHWHILFLGGSIAPELGERDRKVLVARNLPLHFSVNWHSKLQPGAIFVHCSRSIHSLCPNISFFM